MKRRVSRAIADRPHCTRSGGRKTLDAHTNPGTATAGPVTHARNTPLGRKCAKGRGGQAARAGGNQPVVLGRGTGAEQALQRAAANFATFFEV